MAQKWIDYEWPRHLFVELSSACQLSCSYCPRPRVSHQLPFELFKKIVDEASLFGHRSFSLHLFGEPLLHPRIIDCIRYLKGRGHAVILTTNGILLERLYEKLRRVDKIIWSYKKEVKVPEALKSWKNFTVRFFEKREDLSWPRFEIRNYHNYGGQVSTARSTESLRHPCYHIWYAPSVTSTGNIVICCADPEQKSVIGNIKNMTITEAWNSPIFKKIREEHLNGKYSGICKKCDVWKSYASVFGKRHSFKI
jgi:radical SAM protein with 4Fe4S-binding SPASM domain